MKSLEGEKNSNTSSQINKSLVTNLCCLALIGVGFLNIPHSERILNMGLYGLSGAITNWLAIFMLFERIPGLYGSGIIPNRFEEFKAGIRGMIMNQFFHKDNIKRFMEEQIESQTEDQNLNLDPVVELIDFEALYGRLVEAVQESPFGAMLQMFGGLEALEPLKEPFKKKAREAIVELLQKPETREALSKMIEKNLDTDAMLTKIDHIVESRLNELTPDMVKDIIQTMIRQHLGWLVVWGGFFGALIGLVASFIG